MKLFIRIGLGAAMGLALSATAAAAPFCTVSNTGTNCGYYDVPSCQQAAAAMRGACVVGPQAAPPQGSINYGDQSIALRVNPPSSYVDDQRRLADMQLAQARAQQAQQQANAAQQAQNLQVRIGNLIAAHRCDEAKAQALQTGNIGLAAQVGQLCSPQ